MPHPEVLVEMDLTTDTRWYTVKGKHYEFSGANREMPEDPDGFGENAPPDHPFWSKFVEAEYAYLAAKPRLVPAYPQTPPPTPTEDRPGLCPEAVDWEAHRAFLRSL